MLEKQTLIKGYADSMAASGGASSGNSQEPSSRQGFTFDSHVVSDERGRRGRRGHRPSMRRLPLG